MILLVSIGLCGTVCRGASMLVCVCEVALSLHSLAHISQSWRSCAWPDGCQISLWLCFYIGQHLMVLRRGYHSWVSRQQRHVPSLHLLLSGKQAVAYTTRGCLFHLSELSVAGISACSTQAQRPWRVLVCELMLQGKKCSLSFELWAQFPHISPFTDQRDNVLSWWHSHASSWGLSAY